MVALLKAFLDVSETMVSRNTYFTNHLQIHTYFTNDPQIVRAFTGASLSLEVFSLSLALSGPVVAGSDSRDCL